MRPARRERAGGDGGADPPRLGQAAWRDRAADRAARLARGAGGYADGLLAAADRRLAAADRRLTRAGGRRVSSR